MIFSRRQIYNNQNKEKQIICQYDPTTGQWIIVQNMSYRRSLHTASILTNAVVSNLRIEFNYSFKFSTVTKKTSSLSLSNFYLSLFTSVIFSFSFCVTIGRGDK
jgi:hypothetical protein